MSAVKGIEFETGLTMHGVLEDVLDPVHHPRLVALSGPSFASEIARRRATMVTLACYEEAHAITVQAALSCPWFRCYTQRDVIGVETAGALKNVIAIAVGISDGMEGGHNARAALMTRGLTEITRVGVAQGAEAETFLGLAGIGDLLLTCTGDLSRNRRIGLGLGRGRKLDEIVAELGEVAEGVQTTRAAVRLAARLGVEVADHEHGPLRHRRGEDPGRGGLRIDDAAAAQRTRSRRSDANLFANIQLPMNQAEITLDQAPIGHPVRVVSVSGDDADRATPRRPRDPHGVEVECLRRAPLGDPSVFELCGYQLCLRRLKAHAFA